MKALAPSRLCGQFIGAFILFATSGLAAADEPAVRPASEKVDAAALVRQIRRQDEWIDHVESFQIRAKSTWIRTAKSIESERKALQQRFPGAELDPKIFTELRPELTDEIEVAFNAKKLRFVEDQHNVCLRQSTWDGEKLVQYENYSLHRQENYILTKELMLNVFGNFSWPAAQHHIFWWCLPKTEEDRKSWSTQLGEPEDYRYLGRDTFHGQECHVLFRPQNTRLYIDVASGRLVGKTYGTAGTAAFRDREFQIAKKIMGGNFQTQAEMETWFASQPEETQRKLQKAMQAAVAAEPPVDTPVFEYWTWDYKEVAPGCVVPMSQGYVINHVDEAGQAFESLRREFKVSKVEVNAKLPDSLFKVTLKEGVHVFDQTHDPPLSYNVKASRTTEEWKQILDEARKQAEDEQAEKRDLDALVGKPAPAFLKGCTWLNSKPLTWEHLKGRFVIVDFWAVGCGPCWNDISLLKGMHEGTAKSGVAVVAVHSSGVAAKDVQPLLDERKITYPIVLDTPAKDDDGTGKVFDAYHVRRMPYSILVDRDGRVAAHGSLQSLIERISEIRADAK